MDLQRHLKVPDKECLCSLLPLGLDLSGSAMTKGRSNRIDATNAVKTQDSSEEIFMGQAIIIRYKLIKCKTATAKGIGRFSIV